MVDLSVIILTGNEELHIKRCLENVCDFAKEVFVVDCYSKDNTVSIARKFSNVTVLEHAWPPTKYAGQFNWALENADIKTKWVLRLDADEYLLPELKEELTRKLQTISDDITGLVIKRRHIFMGKWMKRGTYPVKLLRIFRTGKAICEQRLMDEHIQLLEGSTIELEYDFCDHNLNNLSWFCHKHVDYAIREAVDLLDIEMNLTGAANTDKDKQISKQAELKRARKHKYAKQPLFWRSFAYFCYRYIIKGACLEGKEGFLWSFIQGWWYRALVDGKVYEIKKACGNDKELMKEFVLNNYGIDVNILGDKLRGQI